jgi:hypothetical protein
LSNVTTFGCLHIPKSIHVAAYIEQHPGLVQYLLDSRTGSFEPIQKKADSLVVRHSGVLVPDRDSEKLEEPLGRFGADIGNDRWNLE